MASWCEVIRRTEYIYIYINGSPYTKYLPYFMNFTSQFCYVGLYYPIEKMG